MVFNVSKVDVTVAGNLLFFSRKKVFAFARLLNVWSSSFSCSFLWALFRWCCFVRTHELKSEANRKQHCTPHFYNLKLNDSYLFGRVSWSDQEERVSADEKISPDPLRSGRHRWPNVWQWHFHILRCVGQEKEESRAISSWTLHLLIDSFRVSGVPRIEAQWA